LVHEVTELGGKYAVVKTLSSRAKRFSETLFVLYWYRIPKTRGSGDPLSRSPVHAGAWDRKGYGGGASSEKRQNPILFLYIFYGDRWYIYRKVNRHPSPPPIRWN
jgi:hypothetical protein